MSERILLLFNPIAGKGRSESSVSSLEKNLKERGFDTFKSVASDYVDSSLQTNPIAGFDAVVVAGGDGTIMNLLPALSNSGVPVYNLPTGNESLFAREFGMKKNLGQVFTLLKKKTCKTCYIPTANNKPFFCMASIGFDSEVVCSIAKARTGVLGHRGYVFPTLKAALNHVAPVIDLSVNGQKVINSEPGFLIVGNCKQYALSMPFVPEASSESKELVARFFPYKSVAGFLWFNLKTLLKSRNISGSRFFRGDHFSICSEIPFPVQADGDYLEDTPVTIETTDNTIKVLSA